MEFPAPGTPVIIDIGSAYTKVGFAGEKKPRHIFPSITGTEKYKAVMADVSTRSLYVGDDAMRMRGVLKISHPIQRGVISDWNAYYEIVNHIIYNVLRLESLSDYPLLYAEQPFEQNETKEYIASLFYQTHKVQSLMMVSSPILSIFSVGLTTGLVIESGDGITWIVPIIKGKIYDQAVQRLNLAGVDVNNNLKALLMREGINLSSSASEEIIREIKEKNCYFTLDPNTQPKISGEKFNIPMPDGTYVPMPHRLLYEAPEVMFQPAMLGYNIMNIPQAIINCLKAISNEYWPDLIGNIVLSGGNMSYNGFEERIKNELSSLLPQLGNIPKSKSIQKAKPVRKKMVQLQDLEVVKKKEDNCPSCGKLIDLSDGKEYCPSCGALMKMPQLNIGLNKLSKPKKEEGKCPFCKKEIQDINSVFCPYCGKSMDSLNVPDFNNVKDPIGNVSNIRAQEFSINGDASNDNIRLFIPDNLQNSIFNGASILSSLDSFRAYFVTYAQFQADKTLLYRDFSQVYY